MKKIVKILVIAMTLITYSSPTLAGKIKQPKPPSDAPKTTRGTASRSNCPLIASSITLTPLIPESSWGYTTSKTPKVWVYISYKNHPDNLLSGKLSLLDKNGDLVQERITVNIPNTSGAFPLNLPHLPESNKLYNWTLEINCGANKSINIEGSIYQKQFSNLTNLKPEKRITYYEEQEIWYDALNEAANLYCQDSRYWQQLLTQEKLELIPLKCSN